MVVMFSCDDRKWYRWQTGLSRSGSTRCGLGWRGRGSECVRGVGILGAQSVVRITIGGCIDAKSVVGRTLGGGVVAGTATLGSGTAILA